MALLRLIRDCPSSPLKGDSGGPHDLAVRGRLYFVTYDVFSEEEVLTLLCPTLENRLYLIPPGRYRLTVTFSPKFQRDLPLVNNVPKAIAPSSSGGAHQGSSAHPSNAPGVNQLPEQGTRSGIRFHPGSKPEQSRGCILVTRASEQQLTAFVRSEKVVLLEVKNLPVASCVTQ